MYKPSLFTSNEYISHLSELNKEVFFFFEWQQAEILETNAVRAVNYNLLETHSQTQ